MKISRLFLFLFLMLSIPYFVHGSTIKGKVTDASTGGPLLGANVIVTNTSLGASTDMEGNYTISNLPAGVYSVKFSYIGFKDTTLSVNMTGTDRTVFIDVELEWVTLTGEEVTISAQALGQLSAINQQLSADGIMNIVDAERIQELPDQNVAEAIARLPGITISRDNGEGSGIGIRGLAPKYNQVQIDGVSMSSSANLGRAQDMQYQNDRSVSLADISQENLAGIEVFKSITADMDAATLGGTVNLRLGKAPSEDINIIKLYGAYNAYQNSWSNYKASGKISRRFFDDKFGAQIAINAERRDRGNDRLSGAITREDIFDSLGVRNSQYRTTGATIRNLRNIREKIGGSAIFDFVTPGTELLFSNFYNQGKLNTSEISRNYDNLRGFRTTSEDYSISNSLRGTHDIGNLEVEWQIAHYKSETDTPDDYQMWFAMIGGDYADLNAADKLTITPEDYLELLPDSGRWSFNQVYKDVGKISETKYSAKLDLKYPFFISNISGFLKTGFLVKTQNRTSELKTRSLFNGRFPEGAEGPQYSWYPTDYNPDPVLNGNVSIGHFFDVNGIKPIWDDWIKDYEFSAYNPMKTPNNDYDITENFYAGYFMMKIKALGDLITFIPGVRYEGDDFDADAYFWYLQNQSTVTYNGLYEKTNAKRSHDFWLPMVHLKIKPLDWLDFRLSATNTISRPDYNYYLPSVTANFNADASTTKGNPDIKTTESWNYDFSTSIYDSDIGLFTISAFYKELKNFSYQLTYYVFDNQDAIDNYGIAADNPALVAGHIKQKDITLPVNTYGISSVKGIELDYQANFHSLPGFLKYLTFSINYTRAFSDSYLRKYSVTLDSISFISTPPYFVEHKTFDIGFRNGRLPTQPDHILNVSLGVDIGGFSGRVSAFFQGRSLAGIGRIASADTWVEDYLRYDMSLRYRVNDNLSFLVSGVNLSSTPDITSLNGTSKHSSYSVYGAMYDFGAQYSF